MYSTPRFSFSLFPRLPPARPPFLAVCVYNVGITVRKFCRAIIYIMAGRRGNLSSDFPMKIHTSRPTRRKFSAR